MNRSTRNLIAVCLTILAVVAVVIATLGIRWRQEIVRILSGSTVPSRNEILATVPEFIVDHESIEPKIGFVDVPSIIFSYRIGSHEYPDAPSFWERIHASASDSGWKLVREDANERSYVSLSRDGETSYFHYVRVRVDFQLRRVFVCSAWTGTAEKNASRFEDFEESNWIRDVVWPYFDTWVAEESQ
ncbi:MAG: hypothetical protein R3E01_10185 [Pirellulaceae bacterium]